MLNLRENVIVSKDNQALFAKNAAVWSVGADGAGVCNVPEGQIVAMDRKTGLGVDATNVAAITNPIKIGVSLGTDIRWLTGEDFYPRNIKSIATKVATCGTPEINDLLWKCTSCYEDYAVKVDVRDNDTMSYSSAPTDFESYIVNARPDCNSCPEDCNPEATCGVVRDSLVTELQDLLDELDIKAYATALYANSFIYCFSHDGGCNATCDDLIIGASSEVIANSGTPIDLSGVTPSTPSTMAELLETLEAMKTLIEADATFVGTVTITKGFGSDCCVQLHVNTPNDFILEDDGGSTITPCTTETPLDGYIDYCGIRVIAAPVTQDSACIITKPLSFYGREVEMYAMSDSFEDAVRTKIVSMTLPQNFGNFVQYEEYSQDTGGQARNYRKTNRALKDGFNGINQDSKSRLTNAITFADVSKSYVSFHIEHTIPHTDYGTRGVVNPAPVTSSIYVSECDTDTKTPLVALLNAMSSMANLPGNIVTNLFEGQNI